MTRNLETIVTSHDWDSVNSESSETENRPERLQGRIDLDVPDDNSSDTDRTELIARPLRT